MTGWVVRIRHNSSVPGPDPDPRWGYFLFEDKDEAHCFVEDARELYPNFEVLDAKRAQPDPGEFLARARSLR